MSKRQENVESRVQIDRAHGGKDRHVDITTPFADRSGAFKTEVYPDGSIRQEVWQKNEPTIELP